MTKPDLSDNSGSEPRPSELQPSTAASSGTQPPADTSEQFDESTEIEAEESGAITEAPILVPTKPVPADRRVAWADRLLAALLLAGAVAGAVQLTRGARAREREHQARVTACESEEREACAILCSQRPPDIEACARLGRLLLSGPPAKQEPARAVELLSKACDAKHADSCAHLGRARYNGTGTTRDPKRAAEELKFACEHGSALGCTGEGHMFITGQGGLAKDERKGVQLLQRSCKAGEQRGCALLGVAYLNATGIQKDADKAFELFESSCDAKIDRGCVGKASMLFNGTGVDKDEKSAVALFKQACEGTAQEACAYLGLAHLFGQGTKKDPERAAALLKRACDKAPPAGCALLGELTGSGPNANPKQAVGYLQRACDHGMVEGCIAVGRAFLSGGPGLERDVEKGVQLIRDACEKEKNPAGCTQLATLELSGVGSLKQDLESSKRRSKEACDTGHGPGCTLYGRHMARGKDNKGAPKAALPFFRKACEAGDGDGCAFHAALVVDGLDPEVERDKGFRMLEKACKKMRSMQGCSMFARVLIMSPKAVKRRAEGVELAEQLCASGEPQSCLLAAAAHIEARGVPRNLERGATFIVGACDGGFPMACEMQKRLPKPLVEKVRKRAKEVVAKAREDAEKAAATKPAPVGRGSLPLLMPGAAP